MHASKGGLSYDQIMRLTWRQFGAYLDAFTWLLREQSPEGQAENAADDKKVLDDPEIRAKIRAAKARLLADTKRDLERHKKFAGSAPAARGVARHARGLTCCRLSA